jgi:hypothetical protein
MQSEANTILETRKKRELAEAGRRQREGVADLQTFSTKSVTQEEPEREEIAEMQRIMTPLSTNFTDLVISSAAEKVPSPAPRPPSR